ncbi:hypothetical protein F5887DRAFT_918661 [Amanita rubescens]|nr:hypothetical protein F5887DRAFT_918661 [Amanita rubescens]
MEKFDESASNASTCPSLVPCPSQTCKTFKLVPSFASNFKEHVLPSITTSNDARKLRSTATAYRARVGELQKLVGINVAFPKAGIDLFLESGNIGDAPFEPGQLAGAETVLDNKMHGLIEVTGYPLERVRQVMTDGVKYPLSDSIAVIFNIEHIGTSTRPDPLGKHEHFGFSDGISQPFVHFEDDLNQKREPLPGQTEINPGVLILGQMADPKKDERPERSKNGSILVYRHRVPEWNMFLEDIVRDSIFSSRYPGLEFAIPGGTTYFGPKRVVAIKSASAPLDRERVPGYGVLEDGRLPRCTSDGTVEEWITRVRRESLLRTTTSTMALAVNWSHANSSCALLLHDMSARLDLAQTLPNTV